MTLEREVIERLERFMTWVEDDTKHRPEDVPLALRELMIFLAEAAQDSWRRLARAREEGDENAEIANQALTVGRLAFSLVRDAQRSLERMRDQACCLEVNVREFQKRLAETIVSVDIALTPFDDSPEVKP